MLGKYLAATEVYNKHEQPSDQKHQALLQAHLIRSTIFGDVPATEIADIWAHFILIPDYLKATHKQKWTKQVAESEEHDLFYKSAERFLNDNVLIKKNNDYSWTGDHNKFYNSWLDVALER
jgi:hypothetical protein